MGLDTDLSGQISSKSVANLHPSFRAAFNEFRAGQRSDRRDIAHMYYNRPMVSGDLIREARLRAGMTQAELGENIGKPQSVIARWERGDVTPSLETLRQAIRGCGLELSFHLSRLDESSTTVIDEHLKMTPAQRLADLLERVRFHDQLQRRKPVSSSA